jgi:hypothetical protein
MRKIRSIGVLAGLLGLLTCSILSAQGWEWVRKAGGAGSGFSAIDEEGSKIVSDANGNVYVAGIMYPNAFFDTTMVPGYGGSDFFLASYDSLGNFRWVKSIGTLGDDDEGLPFGLGVDDLGNVYLCGTVRASSQIYIADTLFSSPSQIVKFFIASFTNSGVYRWAKVSNSGSIGNALAVDSSFGLVCSYEALNTGSLFGSATINSGVHLLRFSFQGDYIESFFVGTFHSPFAIKIYNDKILFAGIFRNSSVIIDDTLNSLASSTSRNSYLCSIDTLGQKNWVRHIKSTTNVRVSDLIINQGNLIFSHSIKQYEYSST